MLNVFQGDVSIYKLIKNNLTIIPSACLIVPRLLQTMRFIAFYNNEVRASSNFLIKLLEN